MEQIPFTAGICLFQPVSARALTDRKKIEKVPVANLKIDLLFKYYKKLHRLRY